MRDGSGFFYDPDLARFGNAVSPFVRMPSFDVAHLASQRRFEDRYDPRFLDHPTASDWLEAATFAMPPPRHYVGGDASYAVGAEAMTPLLFAQRLLQRLGMPQSDNNIRAIVAFQNQEGGHMVNAAWFNPLNTMQNFEGAVQAGGNILKGIKAYRSWDDGVEATARLLKNGLYPGILAALARSAPPEETIRQVSISPFGWYKTVGGVRVPLPHDAADLILHSDAAFRSFATKAYPSVTFDIIKSKLITAGIVVASAAAIGLLTYVIVKRVHAKSAARRMLPNVLPGT